jgi:osmotically inducible protein OsmC
MSIERNATAIWHGGFKTGKGAISTQSGALKEQTYTYASRFEKANQTNPEELIAAAHAGCFSMALGAELEKSGHPAEELSTTATVILDFVDGAPTITKINLVTNAKVPGIDKARFEEIAADAKATCPISRLLKAAEITLTATLV